MQTYEEALRYLDSLVNYEKTGFDEIDKKFDLGKLREVLKKLGNPHKNYRSIHIAGTKGKGSLCTFVSSILRESGCNIGLFTSPHLSDPRERIKINDKIISEIELVSVLNQLKDYIKSAGFTFFEMYTLMAILYFSMRKVDFAVFEVGMGGRLDATNVIEPQVCGISPISYDHTQVLGDTLGEIAEEKAAIIKRGAKCISSPQKGEAFGVIKSRCIEQDADLVTIGKDITYTIRSSSEKGSMFDIFGMKNNYKNCSTNMLGDFQVSNCATAVGICEQVLGDDLIGVDEFKKGIQNAYIPGRMEIISHKPFILVDGAQNGESARELKSSVEQIFKYDRLILLMGVSRDKDIKSICGQLEPIADEIILTRASVDRAMDPHIIRGYIKNKKTKITADVTEALGLALKAAKENDLILVTGSFFIIGEVKKINVGTF